MNRVIAIVLACCILFANTGWAMTTHYCMGERVSVSLNHNGVADQEHTCPKCGMTKAASDNGCCKDEHQVIKSSDDAVFSAALKASLDAPMLAAGIIPIAVPRILSGDGQAETFQPHRSPLYTGPPLYLRNCVFLI